MKRRNLMKTVAAAAFALGLAPATLSAQEVTLRLHQFEAAQVGALRLLAERASKPLADEAMDEFSDN